MRQLLILLFLILVSTRPALAQSSSYHEIEGATYRLTVPESYSEDTPAPLMIALHSTSSSPHAMAVMTGFDDYAEERGMIVAYPQTDGVIWNEGDPRFGTGRDDVALVNDIVAEIQSEYSIDDSQIMLSGFGSGGLMAYRIACESPETFDTIAIVGAMMWGYHADNCPETSAPVNIIVFRGSEDIIYLKDTYNYQGLFDTTVMPILGVDDTLEHWSTRFNCTTEPISTDHIRIYNECDEGVQVAYYEMTGARQNWLRDRDDWKLNQFGVDVSAIILSFASGDDSWQSDESIVTTSTARTYSFYVPTTYDESQRTPVVVVLHGRFGNGAGTASHIEINPLAEEEGFIGIYPDGLNNTTSGAPRDTGWNYLRDVPYFSGMDTPDDTQFIADVMDDLSQELNIDRNRLYVTGLSNGGFMVQRLACEVPEIFAGYASVAGAGFGGMDTVCGSDTPVNMLVMHGTYDNNILWDGNVQTMPNGQQFYMTMPITDTMEFWARKMECFGESTREDVDIPESTDETGLVIFDAGDCNGGAELVLYAVLYGGHNWPGVGDGIPSQVAGQVNVELDATQVIWDFFKSHSLEDFD